MKYYLLVGLLIITTVSLAVQSSQITEVYSQMQENQRDFDSRPNYNHYWMKYLPANYLDYNAANEFQYSEENQYDWDNSWILMSHAEFTYVNNLVTHMYGMYGTLQGHSEVIYDANDRIYQIVLSMDMGSGFEIFMRETFEYNANGVLNDYLKEMYSAGNYTNNKQILFTLDGDQTITFIEQIWDDDNQVWLNDQKFNMTWEEDIVTEILREDWVNELWDNEMLYGYTYVDDKLSESLAQYWNQTIWIDSQNRFFTWDGDLIVNELMEGWNGYEWGNELNQAYTFDSSERPVENLVTEWENDQWENEYRYEYIYNTGIHNNTLPDNSIELSNYPNPFNPSTTIAFDIKEGETGTLTIFNAKGQIIVKEQFTSGEHNYHWDANKFSSGVYLYKLQTESFSQTKKMMMMN